MKMNAYPATRKEQAPMEQRGRLGWAVRERIGRIRRALNKFVVFDSEAIFKDPDWPHLWEHKR